MENQDEKFNFSKREEEILEFWKKNKIFEKSLIQRKNKKKFVFYEGPPTANGQPGIHHVEARTFKDVITRYKTMRGFYCERKAGWDTHGLPVEIQVEKELGLKSKKEIENYGIEKFIERCKESVWRYRSEWEKLTERMAYWLDMKNAYATMANSYIETLWWIFKQADKKKLLYEDYKILPWCPRCGTALSSHEVSQGYKRVKEESIYIKFPVKGKPNTYFLVWTTTPWTLPSNVALAVGKDIEYSTLKLDTTMNLGTKGNETMLTPGFYIIATNRISAVTKEGSYFTDSKEIKKGKDLVGIEYEPLYSPANSEQIPYKIFAADFVSADDGTGVVHIAPAFGEDDMNLGKKEKLPVLSLVDEEGKMMMPGYKWNGMFIKDADPLIIEGLRQRNLLFKTEPYEHDYPFCWRCDSPLMYYAKTSWWLKTTAVKQKMISENKKINWHPDYLKKGRFGEWLNEMRDWAISRERYWGTPLPIWRCDKCKDYKVVGSLDELKKETAKSGNKYFAMRHGFAESNQHNISNADASMEYKLTPRGQKEVLKTAQKLKKEKINLIFASDFPRTKETAFLVAKTLGISEKDVVFDKRLREINTGIFDGKPDPEYHEYFSSLLEKFTKTPPNGENLTDLKNRITGFLYELEEKYENRKILIVSHEYSIWMLVAGAGGLAGEEAVELKRKNGSEKGDFIKTGEARKLEFLPLPRDKNFVLDLHRPYIDKIFLRCEKCLPAQAGGEGMKRVAGVADVWFDSGAMPFAQNHFPFSIAEKKLPYPAEYICEAIDQTRGWFYTLLAVASLLGKKAPYKNVLSLGFVVDEKGRKMAKSRGNIVVPGDLMSKYGADAVRWYFYTINQPWDEKLFKEEDVQSALRRFILIFWNCFTYWKTYSSKSSSNFRVASSKLIINKWLLTRFNQVVSEATKLLDDYDIVSAGRLIENFIVEDVSRWYIRRIREIMKNPKSREAKEVSAVLGFILLNTAKLLAPFMPFISETIYGEAGGRKKSVHLDDWPKPGPADNNLLATMSFAKSFASMALTQRAEYKIKVRQPLQRLSIKHGGKKPPYWDEIKDILADEVNVKEVVLDATMTQDDPPVKLDTAITSELEEEGALRELARQMQDIRKKEGRKPSEMIEFYIATDEAGKNFLVKYANQIKKSVNAKSLIIRPSASPEQVPSLEGGYDIKISELNFKIKI